MTGGTIEPSNWYMLANLLVCKLMNVRCTDWETPLRWPGRLSVKTITCTGEQEAGAVKKGSVSVPAAGETSSLSEHAQDGASKQEVSTSNSQSASAQKVETINATESAEGSSSSTNADANGQPDKPIPPGIPSKPYKPPPNLSEQGRELYESLKSVLDGPADRIGHTLLETSFCEEAGDNTRRVDTRVMFVLHQLLQETMKAQPDSTIEPFKRMLAIKMMIQKPDDPGFASVLLGPHV
jgi:hypothetical protein